MVGNVEQTPGKTNIDTFFRSFRDSVVIIPILTYVCGYFVIQGNLSNYSGSIYSFSLKNLIISGGFFIITLSVYLSLSFQIHSHKRETRSIDRYNSSFDAVYFILIVSYLFSLLFEPLSITYYFFLLFFSGKLLFYLLRNFDCKFYTQYNNLYWSIYLLYDMFLIFVLKDFMGYFFLIFIGLLIITGMLSLSLLDMYKKRMSTNFFFISIVPIIILIAAFIYGLVIYKSIPSSCGGGKRYKAFLSLENSTSSNSSVNEKKLFTIIYQDELQVLILNDSNQTERLNNSDVKSLIYVE